MYYDEVNMKKQYQDEVEEKLCGIIAWAESGEADGFDGFDSDFVQSLKEQYDEKGGLSERQIFALDNIIDKWEIDLAQYL